MIYVHATRSGGVFHGHTDFIDIPRSRNRPVGENTPPDATREYSLKCHPSPQATPGHSPKTPILSWPYIYQKYIGFSLDVRRPIVYTDKGCRGSNDQPVRGAEMEERGGGRMEQAEQAMVQTVQAMTQAVQAMTQAVQAMIQTGWAGIAMVKTGHAEAVARVHITHDATASSRRQAADLCGPAPPGWCRAASPGSRRTNLLRLASIAILVAGATAQAGVYARASVYAQAGSTPVRDHDIVPEDYFTIGNITAAAFSPDGRRIAYTESRWEVSEDGRNTDLWVVDVASKTPNRLTFDPAADASPTWSPDGKWIYFTTSRKKGDSGKPPYNGKRQIWRIRPDGGEPTAVTRTVDGVGSYTLSRDGRTLYYAITSEKHDDGLFDSVKKDFDTLEYGHGIDKYSQIIKLDLLQWRSETIIDDHRVIGEFAVTDDQRRIAMLTTPTSKLITNEGWSRVDIYDAKTNKISTLPDKLWRDDAPSPYGWLLGLAWSTDGSVLAFRCDFDGYPGEIFVAHFNTNGHSSTQQDGHVSTQQDGHVSTQKIIRPDEVYATGHMQWLPDSHDLCFTADDHARTRIYKVSSIRSGKQGRSGILTPGDVCIDNWTVSRDGSSIAAILSTVTHPPDIYLYQTTSPNAVPKRITRANPQVDTWKLPSIQTIQWKSKDGTTVEGILELPPDYEPGTPLPTIIELHGGPTSASKLRFRFWIYGRVLFPARGWALLSPNYR